ncbi:MAG: MHYT domain-containing protein [Pseudomonadota bacterium]
MLSGQYELPLVWISILVAVLASYTALSLVERVAHSDKAAARWWIGGGALAMGTGIWSMHFIGMLAFRLPIPIGYDLPITFLSWLIPVLVSLLALWQVHQSRLTVRQLALSAVLMGIGIVGMHYVGMAAMRMQPDIVYRSSLVAASVAIAVAAAGASLWIAFYLNRQPGAWLPRAGGALIMGLGIVGMHYTGMASADFPLDSVCRSASSGLSLDAVALTVISATVAVLAVTLVTSSYEARLKARSSILLLTEQIAQERQSMLESERAARGEAERARAEAERMSTVKDEFLATLSHELRTPLNAILGWVQLLQVRHPAEPGVRDGLKTIERNARAQSQLIEDLLDMSGMATGKVRLELQSVAPATLIKAALDTATPAAERKSIRIIRFLDTEIAMIQGDSERLLQVLSNLLTNAIKFTPEQGQIFVTLSQSDDMVEIAVADTGVGIPPEFLPHVFELFRQADSSTTRRFGGLGIGLSIVRQLVELHGGTVRASSPGEGEGATFTIALPRLRAASGALLVDDGMAGLADQIARDRLELAGVSVLVVDDEPDAVQLVRAILEECGAKVVTAGSASEALSILMDHTPDVLVCDIGMPEMDGVELIRRIRLLKMDAATMPAIALSAYTREKDRDRAILAGFSRYLPKPVDGAHMVSTIAHLLR